MTAYRTNLRPVTIQTRVNRYAEGSALIEMGNTRVLCTASIEDKVPDWLKNSGKGWVSAEYSMLPRATHTRTKRDREKVSGRTQEIQRLIGRALRTMVNMDALGQRSLMVDCDVLQADGGTRTASITGACVALGIALDGLYRASLIKRPALIGTVAAVSVGIKNAQLIVDLDYELDSTCDVDMNVVMTGDGRMVEVQGTAEREPFTGEQLMQMTAAASSAISELRLVQIEALKAAGVKM